MTQARKEKLIEERYGMVIDLIDTMRDEFTPKGEPAEIKWAFLEKYVHELKSVLTEQPFDVLQHLADGGKFTYDGCPAAYYFYENGDFFDDKNRRTTFSIPFIMRTKLYAYVEPDYELEDGVIYLVDFGNPTREEKMLFKTDHWLLFGSDNKWSLPSAKPILKDGKPVKMM